MTLTLEELESALHQSEPVGPPDLDTIRRSGARRRRARRAALVVSGVLTVSALTGGGLAVLHHHDVPPAGLPLATITPHELDPSTLSPLARRALREVPGARQVSDDVVLIPAGDSKGPQPTDAFEVGHTESLPARAVFGVTEYPRADMPGWLYDEIHSREVAGADADGSYSLSGDKYGVAVDQGSASIGCVRFPESGSCTVSFLYRAQGQWVYDWGMGTDSFLKPGHGMEVFHDPQFNEGRRMSLWIGGLDGTDVASVDFVLADQTRVAATIASDTVSPGDTLFWALVPGELTDVVARDADGNVVADHRIRSCSDPVDCEVR